MFKFLKSKKGFTLVELMIVVVIMAILVAVAVPIYSAVTKNARKKTCIANQREIQSQFGNAAMTDTLKFRVGDKYELKTNENADGGTWTVTPTTVPDGEKASASKADVESLFQKAPYCPTAGNTIIVTFENAGITGADVSGISVKTVCTDTTHS